MGRALWRTESLHESPLSRKKLRALMSCSAGGSGVVRIKKLVRRNKCGLYRLGRGVSASGAYAQSCARRIGRLNAWSLMCLFLVGMAIVGCGSNTVSMGSAPEEAESVLFTAIRDGDLETVKAEISRDSSLLNQTEGGLVQTPLHKAVRAKQLEIVRFLIESGAEVNMFDNLTRTPLAAAMDVEAGAEIVQLLEDHGAVD